MLSSNNARYNRVFAALTALDENWRVTQLIADSCESEELPAKSDDPGGPIARWTILPTRIEVL
jgi:hypothetical protein